LLRAASSRGQGHEPACPSERQCHHNSCRNDMATAHRGNESK
jgi:hypothetical protein